MNSMSLEDLVSDTEHVRTLLQEAEKKVKMYRAILHAAEGEDNCDDHRSLTARQRSVAALVGDGKTNADIANHLGIGESTVRIHVSDILKSLRLRNRTEIAIWWREHGGYA